MDIITVAKRRKEVSKKIDIKNNCCCSTQATVHSPCVHLRCRTWLQHDLSRGLENKHVLANDSRIIKLA
jgi:hypothetical protein